MISAWITAVCQQQLYGRRHVVISASWQQLMISALHRAMMSEIDGFRVAEKEHGADTLIPHRSACGREGDSAETRERRVQAQARADEHRVLHHSGYQNFWKLLSPRIIIIIIIIFISKYHIFYGLHPGGTAEVWPYQRSPHHVLPHITEGQKSSKKWDLVWTKKRRNWQSVPPGMEIPVVQFLEIGTLNNSRGNSNNTWKHLATNHDIRFPDVAVFYMLWWRYWWVDVEFVKLDILLCLFLQRIFK